MPEEGGEVTFIMKMRDGKRPSLGYSRLQSRSSFYSLFFFIKGFTRRLRDKIDSSKVFKVPAYIEGAYGNSESLTHYDTVLLLTGEFARHLYFMYLTRSPADETFCQVDRESPILSLIL